METRERLIIEEAINKAVETISCDNEYTAYFCNTLVKRMTDASVAIFDVSMEAQKFYIENKEPEN